MRRDITKGKLSWRRNWKKRTKTLKAVSEKSKKSPKSNWRNSKTSMKLKKIDSKGDSRKRRIELRRDIM
jgi:hypothetical protein